MNILFTLNDYTNLTGSELYVYEASRVLSQRGHKVSILANRVGGELMERSQELGVKCYNFFDHPEDLKPGIIHGSQPAPINYALSYFQDTPLVATIHSKLVYERPVSDNRIRKYIYVRPEIQRHWEAQYADLNNKGVVIYNGVDTNRFNYNLGEIQYVPHELLFVGTNDHLRRQVVEDLSLRAKKEKMKLVTVGSGWETPPVWAIEEYVRTCTQTASIFMGRTTIEGWMCGKPGWIYEIDDKGNILDIKLTEVPDKKVLLQFDIEYMVDKFLEIYTEAVKV